MNGRMLHVFLPHRSRQKRRAEDRIYGVRPGKSHRGDNFRAKNRARDFGRPRKTDCSCAPLEHSLRFPFRWGKTHRRKWAGTARARTPIPRPTALAKIKRSAAVAGWERSGNSSSRRARRGNRRARVVFQEMRELGRGIGRGK